MNLPASWVDSLFARLAVRYGQAWLRQWEGIDIAAVKADWASELGGFASKPEAIAHALEHLPAEKPPNVGQFLALCRNAPVMAAPALPAPKASAEAVEQAKAYGVKLGGGRDPKQWARDLQRREQNGAKLTAAQRAMWRGALAEPSVAAPVTVNDDALLDAQNRTAERVRQYAEANGLSLGA